MFLKKMVIPVAGELLQVFLGTLCNISFVTITGTSDKSVDEWESRVEKANGPSHTNNMRESDGEATDKYPAHSRSSTTGRRYGATKYIIHRWD